MIVETTQSEVPVEAPEVILETQKMRRARTYREIWRGKLKY